jgi:hypothetical protein
MAGDCVGVVGAVPANGLMSEVTRLDITDTIESAGFCATVAGASASGSITTAEESVSGVRVSAVVSARPTTPVGVEAGVGSPVVPVTPDGSVVTAGSVVTVVSVGGRTASAEAVDDVVLVRSPRMDGLAVCAMRAVSRRCSIVPGIVATEGVCASDDCSSDG